MHSFEQYSSIKKLFRISIFIILVYLTLIYSPSQQINKDDICKITIIISILFIMYDLYYPTVKVEIKE